MVHVATNRPLPTALIVERQRLLVPFLADVAHRAGLRPVVSSEPTPAALRRLRPAVVLLGVDMPGCAPLESLRATRGAVPDAKIVVITRRDDSAWHAVARALGADAVLGPRASAKTLALVVRTARSGMRMGR